ncbi:nitroreductase [Novosphingobium sp. KCTC 2891]|uniref:nitroreductase n=1 Tax=Novosphingobium sp. KCTC 2891 TaxID=2989730 RepID=UPI002222A282|nr:nitroreductase [Novosphingobium sp. KCTC 2891]MCW1385022.1 nitroreductase [Novosphingobium sp. KCTC 2891]
MASTERVALTGDDGLPPEAAVLSRLLADRFSCRSYLPDQVPQEKIELMLRIAQNAASWCNSQPWQVHVTSGEGTERFRRAFFERAVADAASGQKTPPPDFDFPEIYRGIYKERQREVGWQLYDSVGVAFGDREASGKQALENFRLFGAPHAMVFTSPRDLCDYGAIDTGIYLGTLMLAAQSLGIAMIVQAAFAAYCPLVHEHFGIPEDRLVVCGASFGYAAADHPANAFRSRRAPLEEVVSWVDR